MRVYLDNCCFNRPYDNQSQIRISLETQAKLYIQDLVRNKELELATSYMLRFENEQNQLWKQESGKKTQFMLQVR